MRVACTCSPSLYLCRDPSGEYPAAAAWPTTGFPARGPARLLAHPGPECGPPAAVDGHGQPHSSTRNNHGDLADPAGPGEEVWPGVGEVAGPGPDSLLLAETAPHPPGPAAAPLHQGRLSAPDNHENRHGSHREGGGYRLAGPWRGCTNSALAGGWRGAEGRGSARGQARPVTCAWPLRPW